MRPIPIPRESPSLMYRTDEHKKLNCKNLFLGGRDDGREISGGFLEEEVLDLSLEG